MICREDGITSRRRCLAQGRKSSPRWLFTPAAPGASRRGAETPTKPGAHPCGISARRQGSGPSPAPRPPPARPRPRPGSHPEAEKAAARRLVAARGRQPPRAETPRGGRGAERPGAQSQAGGGGRGLTERREGPQDARAGSAASAAPPPGATAPPRRGSGRGGRCSGSSAPGSVATAPARAPAAAGSASAPAASPSRERAWAGPAAPPGRAGHGPQLGSLHVARSLTHCDLQTWEPCQRPPGAGRSSAFTKMAAPAAPHAGAILGKEAPRACAWPTPDPACAPGALCGSPQSASVPQP